MTLSIDRAASTFTPRYGNRALDCGGAQLKAQSRHLATVVTVSGVVDATNIDRICEYSRRFVLTDTSFVLDLSDTLSFSSGAVALLDCIDDACLAAGLEWALIPGSAVLYRLGTVGRPYPIVDSVAEAMHCFADIISDRRRALLPLLTKSA